MNRFVFTIIAILLSVVVGVLLVHPKYQTFEEKKAEIESREKELENIEERFGEVEEALSKLENYQEELAKIDTALPDDPSIPTLLAFLKKTVEVRTLSLSDLSTNFISSFDKEESTFIGENVSATQEESSMGEEGSFMGEEEVSSGKTIQEIEINITVFGSYELFKAFLTDLEESARLIEVKDISFSYSAGVEGGYSFGLRLKTHSY